MSDRRPALERLGDEFERVARAADGARRHGRRRAAPVSRRALVLALVTVVALAAGAVAATTGLLTGAPVEDRGVAFTPGRGAGVPIASSIRLTGLRVADPDGGPAWGLRTLRTTRGLGCVQLGRVQDGKLGVIGRDGAFAGDGKFHELPPGTVGQTDCQVLDAGGHAFVAIGAHGVPASGLRSGASCVIAGQGPDGGRPACPADDLRIVLYGLLGPRATAVTYRGDDGRTHVAPTVGPDGAYLVVVRPDARRPAEGSWTIGVSPGSGLLSVRYRDAPTCRIGDPRRLGGARTCPLVGFRPARTAAVSTADVATTVRARIATGTHQQRGGDKGVRTVTLRFRARVAAHGVGEGYFGMVKVRGWKACGGAYGTGVGSDRDVAVGDVVTLRAEIPAGCRAVSGWVWFHAGGEPTPGPQVGNPVKDPRVGSFSARLPG